MKILVIDDSRDFAETMADILKINGHDTEVAFSGEDAAALFEQKKFDLAFIDVKLPGKNGVDFFLEIKKNIPYCRFVLMTGYSVQELLNFAIENGAVGILEKPFDADKVLEIIKNTATPAPDQLACKPERKK